MKTFEELYEVLNWVSLEDGYGSVEYYLSPGEIHVTLNANDFFYWGTSDSVKVEYEDIPLIQECQTLSQDLTGSEYAWEAIFMCLKEKMLPQGCVLAKMNTRVKNYLLGTLPPREINLLNPYDQVGNYRYPNEV